MGWRARGGRLPHPWVRRRRGRQEIANNLVIEAAWKSSNKLLGQGVWNLLLKQLLRMSKAARSWAESLMGSGMSSLCKNGMVQDMGGLAFSWLELLSIG